MKEASRYPHERLRLDCQQHVLRAVKALIVDEGDTVAIGQLVAPPFVGVIDGDLGRIEQLGPQRPLQDRSAHAAGAYEHEAFR